MQDAGDGDLGTSDGIFVQASSPGVAPGEAVQVTGTVAEQFDQTSIGAVEEFEICGNPLAIAATEIILSAESEPELERFEGMFVTFPEPLTVTGNRNLGTFGELVLSDDGRLFNPTNAIDPNEPANSAVDAAAEANRRRQILLDDGGDRRNPDPLPFLTEGISPRAGDTVTGLTGILGFAFRSYRIYPVEAVVIERYNPRSARPADVGGSHRIAAFNVLNDFTTLGERGADTAAELDRQAAKLVAALGAIDADVVGLIELQNNGGVAIGDLVGRLNVAMGGPTYAALPDPRRHGLCGGAVSRRRRCRHGPVGAPVDAACGDAAGPPLARCRPAPRGVRNAGAASRRLHRGLRYTGPQGRQGAARRAGMNDGCSDARGASYRQKLWTAGHQAASWMSGSPSTKRTPRTTSPRRVGPSRRRQRR